jgi:transposase-like protein
MDSEKVSQRKARRTPEQIEQLVSQFRRSGQTMYQFAQQHGVALSTVARWLRTQRQVKRPRLIEVECAPNPGCSSRMAVLRLSHGLVLELEHGFQAEPIAQLVQLLAGR